MTLKEKILELRKENKSYNEISELLNCAKSTISFHCNNQKYLIDDVEIDIQIEIIRLRKLNKKYDEIYIDLNKVVTKENIQLICKKNKLSYLNRLSEKDIEDIRNEYLSTKNIKKVAKKFNIHKDTVKKHIKDINIYRTKNITGSKSVIEWRKRVKIKLIEYKGGECVECGYNKCTRSLEFHHLDKNEKDFTISGKSWSFERLKSEVDKCILVCSNCHNEIHYKQDLENAPVV
jgi:DNA-binding CsgD family transcriptional regulator